MNSVATALMIPPGKIEEWKRIVQEATGKRRAELEDMHRRLGIRSARWFLQHTPAGGVRILYLEGQGAPDAFASGSDAVEECPIVV